MAVLTREQFMELAQRRISGTDDVDISDLENFTDTINDYEQRANANPDSEWKRRYEENDRQWRERYTKRFFTPEPDSKPNNNPEGRSGGDVSVVDDSPKNNITFDNLFD